jgi:hypothetical protein
MIPRFTAEVKRGRMTPPPAAADTDSIFQSKTRK